MSTQEDERWMQYAIELAAKAQALGEVPVGAVVVRDNKILGEGWNQPISGCDPTAHAEIVALRAAALSAQNYRLPAATLYVSLEPCTMCAGAIVHARIERVVFGAFEPKAGAVVSNGGVFEQPELNHQVSHVGGVCEAQSSGLIQAFFKRRRQEAKAARKSLAELPSRSPQDETLKS